MVLKVSREQQKKQLDNELKQNMKEYKQLLKSKQQKQQTEDNKEYKRQLTGVLFIHPSSLILL